MHRLPCSSNNTQPRHRGQWAITAIVCAALLSGCSIWPKSLTIWSDPEPVQAQAPAPSSAATCTDCLGSAPPTPPTPPAPEQSAAVSTPLTPEATVTASALPEAAKTEVPPAKAMPDAKAPERTTAANATAKAGTLVPGFYINVGLFAVPTNGTKAYKKLEDAALPVFSDGIKTKQGNLTRVRVGPFTSRAEADAAAKQIVALKLEAVVFKH